MSGPDNDVSTASKTISSKFSLSGKAGGSQTLFGEETSTYSDLDETEFNINPKSNNLKNLHKMAIAQLLLTLQNAS